MSFFEIEEKGKVLLVSFNRPEKLNAMNTKFWEEIPILLEQIENDTSKKVIVWKGNGKGFSAGLDIIDFFQTHQNKIFGNKNDFQPLKELIQQMQSPFQKIAESKKIHIAAIHGACIGGGLDFAAACDIRFATNDAFFSIRETKVAIVADLGSLNRLPAIIGQGNTRLMAFTGDDFTAAQVDKMGLLSGIYTNSEELITSSLSFAEKIAQNSSFILDGVKKMLYFQWEKSPSEGLEYILEWNSIHLNNRDFREMIAAFMEKRKPLFE